jgi:STE24 endopeptidase
MEAALYTKIFLGALFVKALIESVLDKRNMDHILKHRNTVPAKFADQITLVDHQKAADYSVAKIKASQIFHFFELIIFLGLTLFGGLELINHWAIGFGTSSITTGLIFFGLLGIISSLFSLPKSLYFTFVIEENYGFNKMTWKTFVGDMIKMGILSVLLGGPIAYSILLIMQKLGDAWWVYAFLFLTSVQLLLIFIYPTFIAPFFNKFTPLPEGEIKAKILALLARCGFKSSGLFVMDASKRSGHGNAYFTGFGQNKRIVFFDNLINTLDPEEVEAVLAHELGHMKKKHVLKGILKAFLFSFIGLAVLGELKNNTAFFNGHGVQTISDYMALTIFSMVSGTYTFLLTPFSSWTSRKHEYEADTFAAENAKASKLISALVKMYKDNASSLTPDPLFSKFYFSHPPALERVSFLESLENPLRKSNLP